MKTLQKYTRLDGKSGKAGSSGKTVNYVPAKGRGTYRPWGRKTAPAQDQELTHRAAVVKQIRARRIMAGKCVYCSRLNPRAPEHVSCGGCTSRQAQYSPAEQALMGTGQVASGLALQTEKRRLQGKEEAFNAFIAGLGNTEAMRVAVDQFIQAKK